MSNSTEPMLIGSSDLHSRSTKISVAFQLDIESITSSDGDLTRRMIPR